MMQVIDGKRPIFHPEKYKFKALNLNNAPDCFKEKNDCRVIAKYLRTITSAQAIFVPPMAFIDQPKRWNLIIFIDKFGLDSKKFVIETKRRNILIWNDFI